MAAEFDILIVGGGPAAAAVISGLRETEASARVGILAGADTPPVYRPDLSKGLWLEEGKTLEGSFLLSPDEATELRLGAQVTGLDPGAHTVTLDSGEQVGYGRLVLATGSAPVTLGAALGPRVLTYREASDYRALRAAAEPGTRAVVIGGGYIGAELASALTQNDVHVTMVMPERYVQERMFPAALAEKITDGFRSRGVDITRGEFASVRADDDGATVALADGTELSGQVVVLGVGVSPRTQLAEEACLTVDGGVVVDRYLRASAPDVYAVGDVARYPDPLLGPRRVEHIDNAESMGRAAGRILAGADAPYDYTPYFWSDLFDDGYEAIGELDSRLETFIDWNDEESAAVVYYLGSGERAGHVRGVLLWNTWDAVDRARAVIEETQRAPVASPEELRGRIEAG